MLVFVSKGITGKLIKVFLKALFPFAVRVLLCNANGVMLF